MALSNEEKQKDSGDGRKEIQMKAMFGIAGVALGLLVVRGFMLDPVEEIGWRMFWHELFQGNIGTDELGEVFKSATFVKSLVGTLVGGALGLVVAVKYSALKQQAEGTVNGLGHGQRTPSQTLAEAEVPKRQITEDISTGIDTPLPPESKNETTPPIQQFTTSSTVASDISSEAAVAEKEASPQAALTSKPGAAGTPKSLYLFGGIIAAGLLGYLSLALYENKQELERTQRTAQQEAAARRAAEQQAEAERQARQETAAREAEAQRQVQQEAEARRIAQEQAEAEKGARQEATAREAEARRIAQQEAEARRKAQAVEAQKIAREQAAVERKANLEIEAQRRHQNALAQLEKKYQYAQEDAKKRYDYSLGRANGRFERIASAEKAYHDRLAKAQKYYGDNRAKAEARYQDTLAKITKAYGQN
ncbi:MAG: hypothetical protein ACREVK_10730 [Gammaproteobacteria bacterium]